MVSGPGTGWQLLAVLDDLDAPVTPLDGGGRPLLALRVDDGVQVYDATCPHRGAHLGYGGELRGDRVVCPFHGRSIRLGEDSHSVYSVAGHESVLTGHVLFGNIAAGPDRGFRRAITALAATHTFVSAVRTAVAAPAALVIENAFDADHFATVHNVRRALGMRVHKGDDGELVVAGALETSAPPYWAGAEAGPYRERFVARAFSPHLVVTEIGEPGSAAVVITGANPTRTGCEARVVLAVPDAAERAPGYVDGLVRGAQRAFRQDIAIWDHLDPDHEPMFDPRDAAVLAFRDFCAAATG